MLRVAPNAHGFAHAPARLLGVGVSLGKPVVVPRLAFDQRKAALRRLIVETISDAGAQLKFRGAKPRLGKTFRD
jgi:hypothetical protein